MNRRTILKGGLVLAVTSHTAVAVADSSATPEAPSIDDFLARALPSEKVRYFSNALMEALAEMHPEHNGWRCHTDHEHHFVLVVPNRHRPGFMFQDTGRAV